jgi:hypothetical protein
MISASAGDYAKNIKLTNPSKPKADYSEVYRKYGEETGKAILKSTDDIISNPKALYGKSTQEIADIFKKEGYEVLVEQSTKGSGLAEIVRVKGYKINMIQVHPGGGRHGLPYIKVKGNGVNFKVIDGLPSDYIGNPANEKSIFYWMGE